MKKVILPILLLLLVACLPDGNKILVKTESTSVSAFKMLFIDKEGEKLSTELAANYQQLCSYTKFGFEKSNSRHFNQKLKIPQNIGLIVIYDSSTLSNEAVKKINDWVLDGGTLFFPNVCYDQRFSFVLGFKLESSLQTDNISRGIYCDVPLIPGLKEKVIKEEFTHNGIKANNFTNEVQILATAANNFQYPVFIKKNSGFGSSFMFNTTYILDKSDRGLLLLPLLKAFEGLPFPIANVSSIFLDDFPSPVNDTKLEPVKSEFNITNAQFISEVWTKDMYQMAEKHHLKYTAMTTFNYNLQVAPPFSYEEWDLMKMNKNGLEQNVSKEISKKVLKNGHELGFHGYNHISLIYKDWRRNESNMIESLKSAQKKWYLEELGEYPVTYVPPTNYIDSIGINALKKGFPSIKYMCSIYYGDKNVGGAREFDIEPYQHELFDVPRISSGFEISSQHDYDIKSLMFYTGIWTHFIHPDDIYQVPGNQYEQTKGEFQFRNQNSLGWHYTPNREDKRGLKQVFESYIVNLKSIYPEQKYYTVKEGGERIRKWRNLKLNRKIDGDKVVLQNPDKREKNFWRIYTSYGKHLQYEEQLKKQGIHFSKQPLFEGFIYNVTLDQQDKLEVPFSRKNNHNANSLVQYKRFYDSFNLLNGVVLDYVNKGDFNGATYMLEDYFFQKNELDPILWSAYLKYMNWQNKGLEVWYFLDKYLHQYNSPKNRAVAKTYAKTNGFYNPSNHKKWLHFFMEYDPTDISFYKDYIKNNYTPNNYLEIKYLYALIYKYEPTEINRANYLWFLYDMYPNDFIKELNDLFDVRNKLIKSRANDLAWFFADRKIYPRAMFWLNKSGSLDSDTMVNWLIESGDFKTLREKYLSQYLNYLISNNKEAMALAEIETFEVCGNDDLIQMAEQITWAYAEQNNFVKALQWSTCAQNIDIMDQMSWLLQIGNYNEIYARYFKYVNTHKNQLKELYSKLHSVNEQLVTSPNNKEFINQQSSLKDLIRNKIDLFNSTHQELRNFIADIYMSQDEYKNAWMLTDLMLAEERKEEKRKILNEAITSQSLPLQEYLLQNAPNLFYKDNLTYVKDRLDFYQNPGFIYNTSMNIDKTNFNTIESSVGYVLKREDYKEHIFSLLGATVFRNEFLNDNTNQNKTRSFHGIQYTLQRNNFDKKYNYKFSPAILVGSNKIVGNLSAGLSILGNKTFRNFELNVKPPPTSIAYSRNIYQTQLNMYQEFFNLKNEFLISGSADWYTDNNLEGTLSLKYYRNILNNGKGKLAPFIEGLYSKGSTNNEGGVPYFMIDERNSVGMGLRYAYKLSDDPVLNNLNIYAEPTYFRDSHFTSYMRYLLNLEVRLQKFTNASIGVEYYSLANFYSNNIQIGLVHTFK